MYIAMGSRVVYIYIILAAMYIAVGGRVVYIYIYI